MLVRTWFGRLALHWALLLVLALELVIGGLALIWTPPLEAADEAAFLADAVDAAGGQDNPAYATFSDQFEDGQAPRRDVVYRALFRAAVNFMVDVDQNDQPVRPNPYVRPYDPEGTGNKNALIFPLTDGQLARVVRLMRWFSLLMMLFATSLVYRVAFRLNLGRATASAAAALFALSPVSIIAASTANSDALTVLALAILLTASVHTWQTPSGLRPALLLGAIAGLAGWVSPTVRLASLLAPVALLPNDATSGDPAPRRRAWLAWACGGSLQIVLAALGLLGIWQSTAPLTWLVQLTEGIRALPLATLVSRFAVLLGGVGGWRNVPLDRAVYTILAAITIFGLGGLGMALVRHRWSGAAQREHSGWWLVVGMALLVALRGATLLWRAQGLLTEGLAPMLVPGAILVAVGIGEWLSQRLRWTLTAGLVLVLLAMTLPLLPWRAQAVVGQDASLAAWDDDSLIPVGIEYGSDLYLVGYETDRDTVSRGERLTVRLVWLTRRQPATDYTVSVEITGRQRMQVGIVDTMPGGGRLPTSAWIPGQIISDEVQVPISAVAQTPTRGDIRVTVYSGTKEQPLEARAPNGGSLGVSPRIGMVRLAQPNVVRYEPAAPVQADLGDFVRLFGLNASPNPPLLGSEWTIDLYWQALGPISQDYTVFAHLVNAYGRILAQTDEQPLQGDYPTSLWQPDEQVFDRHVIQIPDELSGEPYFLFIGMYDAETGERLTYTAADGTLSDHVTLGPLLPAAP